MTDETDIIAIDIDDDSTGNAVMAAGQAANAIARRSVFRDYRERRSDNTLRAQDADLNLFATYMEAIGAPVNGDLSDDPAAWLGVTWGLVEGFVRWQLQQEYAIGSVNRRLSTVKKYVGLAFRANILTAEEYAQIRTVTGYSTKESKRVDRKRARDGGLTRRHQVVEGEDKPIKKAKAVRIDDDQADHLKNKQPDTPQGRRDGVLMCLLLDHGLRCGEVAGLVVEDVDLDSEELIFYRPKVDKEQTHYLTEDTIFALEDYLDLPDAPHNGSLLRGSLKGGKLSSSGMGERAITARVKKLGEAVGIDNLSAHDCRHYWATRAARAGTDPFALQEAGGWNSLAMPRRYVEDAKVANERVSLDDRRRKRRERRRARDEDDD